MTALEAEAEAVETDDEDEEQDDCNRGATAYKTRRGPMYKGHYTGSATRLRTTG